MQVTLELPDEIAKYLGGDPRSISRAALEALVVDGLRNRKLSAAQARRILGLRTRFAMDAFLKERCVDLPLTMEQVQRDTDNALSFSK